MERKTKKRWNPAKVRRMYRLLEAHFGDLGWWPADSDLEVVVGAMLTQNTAWVNVEKAISAMKLAGLMSPKKIMACPAAKLSEVIRPAGYPRVKAMRLKSVCRFLLDECGGRISGLKTRDAGTLRDSLLEVNGIGPETADSILLYALQKPVFVVDAYTRRIFSRHGLARDDSGYEELRAAVEKVFRGDIKAFNQFHALIVETGKNYCKKKKGLCGDCPLGARGEMRNER